MSLVKQALDGPQTRFAWGEDRGIRNNTLSTMRVSAFAKNLFHSLYGVPIPPKKKVKKTTDSNLSMIKDWMPK